jgi:hypothetical protein
MSSKQAALEVFRAVDTAFEVRQPAQDDQNFIPSKWDGARQGYVFKTGPLGLGYYIDDVSVRKKGDGNQRKKAAQRDAQELLEVPLFTFLRVEYLLNLCDILLASLKACYSVACCILCQRLS